jgi:hypothetical protein
MLSAMGPASEREVPPPSRKRKLTYMEDSAPIFCKKSRPHTVQAVVAPAVEPSVSNACQPAERKRKQTDPNVPSLKRAMMLKEQQRS